MIETEIYLMNLKTYRDLIEIDLSNRKGGSLFCFLRGKKRVYKVCLLGVC